MNETATILSSLSQTAIATEVKDGSVLLSIDGDLMCRLNGVGAMIWIVLEKSDADLTLTEIVNSLSAQFESINREGQLHYEVTPDRLRRDVEKFVRKLVEKRLLQSLSKDGIESFRIASGVIGTTSSLLRSTATTSSTATSTIASPPDPPVGGDNRSRPFKREVLLAFIGLTAFDLLLRFAGFSWVLDRIARWPTARPEMPELIDRSLIVRVRETVIQARGYYPRDVMCLQYSAVLTCLLRRRGVPAQMVIGAQAFPPLAHSWVEVEGRVVNDRQGVRTEYRELRRI
ncbi:MAG TPA: lasso peptide biosynthesis B2 protein [Blastocatellia bacterium]|nr:lasso peptide biosynthesis B2 protein [Blastocatellia bacterium]